MCQILTCDKIWNSRAHPARNSLLGWVTMGDTTHTACDDGGCVTEEDTTHTAVPGDGWSCQICTLLNPGDKSSCDACHTQRHGKVTHVNSCDSKGELQTVLQSSSNTVHHAVTATNKRAASETLRDQDTTASKWARLETLDLRQRTGPDKQSGAGDALWQGSVPLCSGHQKNCTVNRVHKAGENKNRMFYACPMKRGQQCKFFQVNKVM